MTTLLEIHNAWSNEYYNRPRWYEDDEDGYSLAMESFHHILQMEMKKSKKKMEEFRGDLFIDRIGTKLKESKTLYCVEDAIEEACAAPNVLNDFLNDDDLLCQDTASIASSYLKEPKESTVP